MSSRENNDQTDGRLSWFRRLWFLSFSLLGCFLLYQASPWSRSDRAEAKRVESKSVSAHAETGPITRDIEVVRAGQRLWSDNPEVDTPNETAVDPASWKLLRLRAEEIWEDGTVDDINIVTLQPPEWLVTHQAEVGRMVPLPLDLVEMGLSEDLMAKVVAIDRCPPLENGPGRVVLTTVNHLNRDVFELTVADSSDRRETVYPTGLHKLYRNGQWTSVEDLHAGDRIEAFGKPVTVVSSSPLRGAQRVYNLTVEGEHVYHVSQLGLLAHNNDCAPAHGTNENPVQLQMEYGAAPNRNALSPSNYPNPDPPMSAPPVRYEPQSIGEVIRMRQGKGPTTKATHGNKNIEAHHRQQRSVENGGILDELEMETHRGSGSHTRHNRPSELTPAQRAKEIREHYKRRGGEYILPGGEGI